MALVEFTPKGFYCPPADVFIDPWKPVKKAVITHAHADHARKGNKQYICTEESVPIVKARVQSSRVYGQKFGKPFGINGVKFSFHPAGHIYGSAQIKIEYRGEIWVISGDYKTETDTLSGSFEPIRCHTFVTECTFGLPIYKWRDKDTLFAEINDWWRSNQDHDRTSMLLGYSLGKAQRLLVGVDTSIGPVFCHGAIDNMNKAIQKTGFNLPKCEHINWAQDKNLYKNALVLAPPSAYGSPWMRRFKNVSIASASGWMQLRGSRRRQGVDRGFVVSDHADWEGLNKTIEETKADKIYVTHGYTEIFKQWLLSQGYDCDIVQTRFNNQDDTEED